MRFMILRCVLCGLVATILMSLALVVHAQEDASTSEPAPKKRTRIVYREKSYYDFEDTLVNGNLRKPDGSFIFRKNQSSFSSALNLKRSFIPELRQSSQDSK